MKKVKVTIIELGKEVDTVIELRRDINELAKELNISKDIALKLAVMEVLNDDWKSPCTCTFKNWKNKRIYFRTSNGSNRSNGRQRYYDLETNELIDQGIDYLDLKSIRLGLSTIREAE